MKIKSSYRDYYDFVAHSYGGGDPRVVYLRHRLNPLDTYSGGHLQCNVNVEFDIKRSLREIDNERYFRRESSFKYLCVAGKYYLCLITKDDGVEVVNPDKHPDIVANLIKPRLFGRSSPISYYIGCEDDNLTELSRLINAPVFVINGYKWNWKTKKTVLEIDSEIPVLGDIGFAALYKPEQLYQDIAYFLGNKIKVSPDLAPPVEVSDKDRIVQHGFDLKQSFRHRK